jgi:Na+-translocating ferredoxin:NAD+ oxidoreductase subunit D
VAVFIGKMIFGGIGASPFNPTLMGMAVLMMSWNMFFDFDTAYVDYDFAFTALAPLAAVKAQGAAAADMFILGDLFMGREVGAIGATFGLGLIIGGIYLILRGYSRWELAASFIAGILVTAFIFHAASPDAYAGPLFHLLSGYTLLGAFFLITESASSPVKPDSHAYLRFSGRFHDHSHEKCGRLCRRHHSGHSAGKRCQPASGQYQTKCFGKGYEKCVK